jgi:hypothetical protein
MQEILRKKIIHGSWNRGKTSVTVLMEHKNTVVEIHKLGALQKRKGRIRGYKLYIERGGYTNNILLEFMHRYLLRFGILL